MGKVIITSADVENAIRLNKKEIEIDENSIVTGVAREEAEKKGLVFKRKSATDSKKTEKDHNEPPVNNKDIKANDSKQNLIGGTLETDKILK